MQLMRQYWLRWLVPALIWPRTFGLTVAGTALPYEYGGDYLLAIIFGLAFQYFVIAPMRGLGTHVVRVLPGAQPHPPLVDGLLVHDADRHDHRLRNVVARQYLAATKRHQRNHMMTESSSAARICFRPDSTSVPK